jgi:hypothetical protein
VPIRGRVRHVKNDFNTEFPQEFIQFELVRFSWKFQLILGIRFSLNGAGAGLILPMH